jgi:hypothetical protein
MYVSSSHLTLTDTIKNHFRAAPNGLSLTFHGPTYPSTSSESQSLNVTLLCTDSTTSDPTFTSYNGSVLSVEWSHAAGCGFIGDEDDDESSGGGSDDKDKGGKQERVGSGIGWFFLV